jgi:hypothetical protein
MFRSEFSHYVEPTLDIVGNNSGCVTVIDDTILIKPVYEEVLLVKQHHSKVVTLLVCERRGSGVIIGIYSASLLEWIHPPQFTDVTTKDSHTLWVWVGKLRGECDLITGDISWYLRK